MIEAIRQKPQILVRVKDSGSDYWDGTPEQEPICPKGIGLFPIYRRTRQSLRKLNDLVEFGFISFSSPDMMDSHYLNGWKLVKTLSKD